MSAQARRVWQTAASRIPRTAPKCECRKFSGRERHHQQTPVKRGALRATELDRQRRGNADSDRIDGKKHAEDKRREAIVLLHDNGEEAMLPKSTPLAHPNCNT